MPDDLYISGASTFAGLARALKAAGRKDLSNALIEGLRQGMEPVTAKTREVALERLPKAGGLNELVAAAPQSVKIRAGKYPSVRLVAGVKGAGAGGADLGVVRHPVFGNRKVWRTTKVPPFWFSDTVLDNLALVLPSLQKQIERVVEEVLRGG